MIRTINFIRDIVPSLIFVLVAAFLSARMLIGLAPDWELSWRLYFLFAPFGREVGVFVDASPSWQSFASVACLMIFGVAVYLVSIRRDWLRTRFLTTHSSLLVTIFALNDERVFSAASSPAAIYEGSSWWPELATANPVLIALLLALAGLCLAMHWHIISRLTSIFRAR